MAIVHFAWQFDVAPFVEQVNACAGADGLDAQALREQTRRVVTAPDLSGAGRGYLSAIAALGEDGRSSFDDESGEADDDVTATECYQMLMADHVAWAPSIRDSRLLSAALAAAGCPASTSQRVIFGDDLGSFAGRHHEGDLGRIVAETGLATDGILEREDRLQLAETLDALAPWFQDPPTSFVIEVNATWGRMDDSFRSLLFNSWCDAITMLRFEIGAPRALRLFEAW